MGTADPSEWAMLGLHATAFAAAGRTRVALIGSASSIVAALDSLRDTQLGLRLFAYTEEADARVDGIDRLASLQDEDAIDAAVLVDEHLPAIRRYQARCVPLHRRGIPVAVARGRPIFTSTPPLVNQGILTYAGMFHLAAMHAESLAVPGDYLEFGVFDGRTMCLAHHTIGARIPGARLIGFDTFSGIVGGMASETSLYPDGAYMASRVTLEHNLALASVPRERVLLVEGDVRHSLLNDRAVKDHLGLSRCLVAHFDCDVYAAARAGLEFLTSVIDDGTMLLFDEYEQWGGDPTRGEKRALREWLAAHPEFHVELYQRYNWASVAFVVRRTALTR